MVQKESAKTFLISQFIYIMQSVGIPDNILDKINRTLYAFLWKRKYNKKAFEKVQRRVLAQDIEKGGLGMIDMKLIQEALYLGWIPKLINKSTDKETWKTDPTLIYSNLGLNLRYEIIYKTSALIINL